jgi:hypothetical protein
MIATILVPVGGGESDQVVFETALAVATALNAHLDFVHVRIGALDAALDTPHIGFAMGGALANTLKDLAWRSEERAEAGLQNVRAVSRGSWYRDGGQTVRIKGGHCALARRGWRCAAAIAAGGSAVENRVVDVGTKQRKGDSGVILSDR